MLCVGAHGFHRRGFLSYVLGILRLLPPSGNFRLADTSFMARPLLPMIIGGSEMKFFFSDDPTECGNSEVAPTSVRYLDPYGHQNLRDALFGLRKSGLDRVDNIVLPLCARSRRPVLITNSPLSLLTLVFNANHFCSTMSSILSILSTATAPFQPNYSPPCLLATGPPSLSSSSTFSKQLEPTLVLGITLSLSATMHTGALNRFGRSGVCGSSSSVFSH